MLSKIKYQTCPRDFGQCYPMHRDAQMFNIYKNWSTNLQKPCQNRSDKKLSNYFILLHQVGPNSK